MTLPPEEVGRRIREARKAKGWTNEQLAQRMDVNWRTVQRWQVGVSPEGKPTLPRITGPKGLMRLAEVLEVPTGYLIEQEDREDALRELQESVAALDDRLAQVLEELRRLGEKRAPARRRAAPSKVEPPRP